MKSDAELGISPPSACVRRHRGRLLSEDGAWDPAAGTQGAAVPIRHTTSSGHSSVRPQSEYLERAPDPEMLAALQPLQATFRISQPLMKQTSVKQPTASGSRGGKASFTSTKSSQKATTAPAKKR